MSWHSIDLLTKYYATNDYIRKMLDNYTDLILFLPLGNTVVIACSCERHLE